MGERSEGLARDALALIGLGFGEARAGSKNTGTIKVTDDSVLRWTHSESGDLAFFTITDDAAGISVTGDARKGTSALEPGTYKNVNVSGSGDWTITIKGR